MGGLRDMGAVGGSVDRGSRGEVSKCHLIDLFIGGKISVPTV